MELSGSQRKRVESSLPEEVPERPEVKFEPLDKRRKKVPEAELEHPSPIDKKRPENEK